LSIAFTPGLEKLAGAPDNPLYLVDSDPIKLCHLRARHPVACQGADSTELRGRYLGGHALGGRPSPYLLRFRSRFDLRRPHRHHRRDREDTWLPPRLVLSRRGVIRGRHCYVCTCGLRLWLEQVFCNLARSVASFTIVTSGRRLPICGQEIPQKKSLTT
jgi:hypothetical protein